MKNILQPPPRTTHIRMHGAANIFERMCGKTIGRIHKYVRQGVTFFFVNIYGQARRKVFIKAERSSGTSMRIYVNMN